MSDSGCISDEHSLIAIKKLFEIEKIICDNAAYPEAWGTARLPFNVAGLYARLDNRLKAIEYLGIAAEAAKAFDMRPEKQVVSSILLGDVVEKRIDFETSDTRPLCEIMRDKWLTCKDFDKLRNTAEFKEIINILR